MANAIPAVGSRISLVSSGDIRYEGILYSIDMVESKIALQQVKSFGTEGRRIGDAQVPPSDDVYEYIVFRGSDIKELNVLEYARPRGAEGLNDPAIISAVGPGGSPPMQAPNMASQGNYGQNLWNQGGSSIPAVHPSVGDKANTTGSGPAPTISVTPSSGREGQGSGGNWWQGGAANAGARYANRRGAANTHGGGSGNYHRGRGRGGNFHRGGRTSGYNNPQRNIPPPVTIPAEDFNFEEQLAKFKKDDVVKQQQEATSDVPTGKYTKDEFFDTMSCEALEKLGGGNTQDGRRTFAEQRKVDVETFGGMASNMNRRGRWGSRNTRGRGRGRGWGA